MKLAPRQKIYFSAGLAALLAIVLISAAVFLLDAASQQGKILLAQKQTTENFFADRSNFENIKKDYESFESQIAGQRALISPRESVGLIVALEDIARQNSMSQEIGTINNQSTAGDQNVLQLQIFLRGTFPNFLKYLIGLENLPYLNDLESLQIGRISASDVEQNQNFKGLSAGDINASLIISAYLQK